MDEPVIHTIDLNFLGRRGTIAAYLIPHSHGCILIETGPGSTIPNLMSGVNHFGFTVEDITDVLLTHIHLDHAGASGWLAQQGCQIHVHEKGAPHLINPEKLLASASRLYGDRMDTLWGEFLPVAPEKITIMHDEEVVLVGDLSIRALDVPGHASHHLAYLIGDACFSGDICGIRLNSQKYLSLPMPPPDLNLEMWRASIQHIQKHAPKRIIPTHFGVYPDGDWHLQAVRSALDEVEAWVEEHLPGNPSIEDLRQQFVEFEQIRAMKYGVEQSVVEGQQIANPSSMSADGIFRYWNKFRALGNH
jgi:glyoxylase-like metal-dependent hydrolase (beta-lactamase superfamily II)